MNLEERQDHAEQGLKFKNPFDLGVCKNLKRVFGDAPWYLALLPAIIEPDKPVYPFVLQSAGDKAVTMDDESEL